jgi:hypothetical protein
MPIGNPRWPPSQDLTFDPGELKMIETACNKYKKLIHTIKKKHRKSYTKKYKFKPESRHNLETNTQKDN